MPLVAGIDSSTQSCKVVIRDLDSGELVRSGQAPHPRGTELHPEAWWTAMQTAVTRAGGLSDVLAVSVAAQQHSLITLDHLGEVVRPALLWHDNRNTESVKMLITEIGADEYARRAGSVPVASFTATKLRWLRDHEPWNAARVAAVALPHDWLTWKLLGYGPDSPRGPQLESLTTDRSDASGTSYWSPSTGAYDLALFEHAFGRSAHEARPDGRLRLHDDSVVLPRVLSAAEAAGETCATDFGPAGVLVAAGAGDNAAAALGLEAQPSDLVISIGTSGTVATVSNEPHIDPAGEVFCFADASGRFLSLVGTLNAATSLTATAELLQVDHAEFARLALLADPGSGGVTFDPHVRSERTPNLLRASGRLEGMTATNYTRPNVARAVVEAVMHGLAVGADALRRTGLGFDQAVLIGGAAHNSALHAVATLMLDVPIVVPARAEYAAAGAATQAAWALIGVRPRWPRPILTSP